MGALEAGRPFASSRTMSVPAASLNRSISATGAVSGSTPMASSSSPPQPGASTWRRAKDRPTGSCLMLTSSRADGHTPRAGGRCPTDRVRRPKQTVTARTSRNATTRSEARPRGWFRDGGRRRAAVASGRLPRQERVWPEGGPSISDMTYAMVMQDSDWTAIDLNLLVALQALLVDRHVTRAAGRLHMSQPAMSRALGRLRELFADELLVRVGQQMRLTPRAEGLFARLQDILGGIGELVSPIEFDPSGATGVFRIAAPDILTYMLVPSLLRRLARDAPHIDLEIVQWTHAWREHLQSGEVDLTVGQPSGDEAGFYSRLLARNTWACVLRRGHPALSGRWTVKRYAALSHLLIGITGHGGGQVDAALAARGARRRVALRMPYVV